MSKALIVEQKQVAPGYFRLTLDNAQIARTAKPGHFVHVLTHEAGAYDPLLRRAFSVLRTDGDSFDLLYRAAGRGTLAMSRWRAGISVDVLGPLGQPFPALQEHSLLVGGGVGVPPLAMLASRQTGQTITALIGGRSRVDVLCVDDFENYHTPVQVATEDGSLGHRGYVTDLLDNYLKNASEEENANALPAPHVYACGPLPMLCAIARICKTYGVGCHVSLEEAMPCGVGVCNGCVVATVGAPGQPQDEYSTYRRLCVQGPVLNSDEVDWERITALHL